MAPSPRIPPISARVYVFEVSADASLLSLPEICPQPLVRMDRDNSRCLSHVPVFGL
jgi:hypothetical protein